MVLTRHNNGNALVLAAMLIISALLLGIMAVHAPTFYRPNNLINVLVQASMVGLLAVGMCYVMVGGGIDLSMPSILAFSGIVGAMYMRQTQDVVLGPIVMLATGAALGAFNGIAVAYLRMAPFVVTLATMTVVGGVSVWVTGSQSIVGYPTSFEDVFLAKIAGLPVSVWLFLLGAVIAAVVMARTSFGRSVQAVGFNSKAALIGRIPVKRILLVTYVISGALAGLTAILLVARLGAASANLASDSLLLDIISACVIGRVSIYGGVGKPLNAALGAVMVIIISNSMNQLGVSYYASLVIKGVVIIGFVYLDRVIRRKQA